MAKQRNTAKTPNTKKQKMGKRSIINAICIVFLSICVIGSSVAFILVQNILAKPQIQEGIEKLTSNSSSIIYDRDGNVFKTLSGESGVRENIKYEEMPQVVIDAFLAIEDSRFFKHSGFDLPRFIASGWSNIVSGGIVQGGSTLTMQLVDVKLFPESQKVQQSTVQKLEQKVVEIFKSMDIESKIDKEKILELYLNSINFGGPARGIQKGAQYYFGKDAKNLTLTEAAFLAGVINAPGAYNPYTTNIKVSEDTPDEQMPKTYYEKAMLRRNNVLSLMNTHGYISDEEEALAKSSKLAFQLNGETNFSTEQYQSFVDTVIKEVITKTGKDPYLVPMKIYTTMDRDAQNVSDALLNGEGVTFPDERITAGFTAIDNQTGEILAVGGGRGYSGDTRKNHATEFTHQIGSTAKPIMEYVQAFDHLGYSTEHVIEDAPVAYTDASTTLMNADRTFHGDVPLKQAIGSSYNIPAYKTLKEVVDKIGVKKEVEILNKMGIHQVTESNFAYGMSIGGDALSLTTLQVASAYSVFANGGNRVEPYCVSKIDFEDSKIDDYEAKPKKINNIVSDEAAYLMSYILRDVVTGGYGTVVGLDGPYPIYAKSGTTDNQETGKNGVNIPMGVAKDKWMAAYTNKYSVATWVGYEDYNNPDNYFDQNKLFANIEGIITRALLDSLTDGVADQIEKPSGVVSITHVQGLFPYASASGGKMVTGLIRQKFAKLENSVTADPLDSLSSLNVSLKDNTVSVVFPEYKDSGTSKTVKVGSTSFTFTPMFNKLSLFGGIRYRYEISINGTVVDTGSSESSTITKKINSSKGDKVKVCGFYSYGNGDGSSNKVCEEVTSDAASSYTIGTDFTSLFANTNSFADAKAAVLAWASTAAPDVNFEFVESPNAKPGKLDPNSPIKEGVSITGGGTYTVAIGKDD